MLRQRGRDLCLPFRLPSDTLEGAIMGRTGVGLGTHWSQEVDFGTFLCGPGAKAKQSIAL